MNLRKSIKFKGVKIGVFLVCFVFVFGVAWFANASTFEATLDSLNSQNFPFIFLNARVTDNGLAITDLSSDNFQCSENGVEQTDYFQVTLPQTSGGVRLADIIFLIDTSGSMGNAIDEVKDNVNAFADALIMSDVDYRLGLVQFGQSLNRGHPQLFNGGNLTDNVNQFKEFVNMLSAYGSYEPGFLALRMAAQGFNFRPGAQKVFLIISDEDSDDRDKESTVALMQANDIVVHAAVSCSYWYPDSDYCDDTSVRAVTGGQLFNVQGPYDDILDSIVEQTASAYIIRYESSNPSFDGTERAVECMITRGVDQAVISGSYIPGSAPLIVLSSQTEELNQNTLPENSTDAIIRASITDEVEPFVQSNSVRLYYRISGLNSDYSLIIMNLNGQYYEATISIVKNPGIDYYITATDGEQTSSLPSTDPSIYPFQIAVLPNVAPDIDHESVISAIKNQPVTIIATITDTTNFLAKAMLKYRHLGELIYKTIEMQDTSSNIFEAVITANDVTEDIEYYLIAKDDFDVAAFEATADNPFVIEIKDQPQCSDWIDNDEDGLTDMDDPGCHTDGDATNDDSYDPKLDNENLRILSVPYYHQGDTDWCILVSMSMILKYYYNVDGNYSANIHSWDIANQLGFKRKIWFFEDLFLSEDEKVEKYFEDNDLSTIKIEREDIKFNTIKELINDNNPIFLAIHKSLKLNHAVVIVGYKIINGKKIVYINDPSGILSEKNIGQGRDSIVREVEWDDLSAYFGSNTYAISVGGSPNLTNGTIDIDMYTTNGFYFGKEGNRIYSWAYGDDIGMGWKSQSDRPQLLNKEDSFGYMKSITNHTASEQSYKIEIIFSSDNNEYLADPIFIDDVKEYENKIIALHPVPLEGILGNNYGEYVITLTLWGGNDFTEKYDEIVFPSIEYVDSSQEEQSKFFIVNDIDVNLRAEATIFSASTMLPKNWILKVNQSIPTVQDDKYTWWPVEYAKFETNPMSGWVVEKYLTDISEDDLLPVAKSDYFVFSSLEIEKAIKWANSEKDKEWRDDDDDCTCLGFVREAFGSPRKWTCAYEQYEDIKKGNKLYGDNNSWNSPRGALVFFDYYGKTKGIKDINKHWGHIGIYTGNKKVIHVWDKCKIRETDITSISYPYLGWASPEELFRTYTFKEDDLVGFFGERNLRSERLIGNNTVLEEPLKQGNYIKIISDADNGIFHEDHYWWKAIANKKDKEGKYIEGWFAEGENRSEQIIKCPEELDKNGWCTKDVAITIKINSPGDLQVYDFQGRVSGLVNGEIVEEIPNSMYDKENHIVIIFFASPDSYFYKVVGNNEGTYGLIITSIVNGEEVIFNATDIPTTASTTHQYTIDWQALANGEEGVTVQIDKDGDGVFEETFTTGNTLDMGANLETQIAVIKLEYGGENILSAVTVDVGDGVIPLLLSELKESSVDLEDYTTDGILNPGQKKKLKIKFKFLETAGNEYQDQSINVNFKFLAT